MPNYHQTNSAIYTAMRQDPIGAIEIALALQNPNAPEYKKLMKLLEIGVAKEELCELFLVNIMLIKIAEAKEIESKHESRMLHAAEHEKREAAQLRNERIEETQRETVKAAISEQTKAVEPARNVEKLISEINVKIDYKNQEIQELEKTWKESVEKSADKFISDNFTLNENGKLTSNKNPAIELLDTAAATIKKVFTDAKSPADLQKHNPHLIENPERMLIVDDVRKGIQLAKKVNKILDKDDTAKAIANQKILVKEIVRDDNGDPVFEVDASGKKKVKTKPVYRESIKKMSDKDLGSQESRVTYGDENRTSKVKEGTHVVCVGAYCHLEKNVLSKPVTHTQEEKDASTMLLTKGRERSELEAEKKQLEESQKAVVEPMKLEATAQQLRLDVNKTATEEPEEKPSSPRPGH